MQSSVLKKHCRDCIKQPSQNFDSTMPQDTYNLLKYKEKFRVYNVYQKVANDGSQKMALGEFQKMALGVLT